MMNLTPTEMDRLTMFTAAELARRHRAQGIRLSHPEAVAQRDAHAGARGGAGGGGARLGGRSTDSLELGPEAGRGPAGMAAQAAGTPWRPGRGAEEAVGQSLGGGRAGQGLPDRTMDPGAGSQADRTRVRGEVQHGQRLTHPARVGFFQPTPDGSGDPARRGGDQIVAHQALVGAKKSPSAKAAPSSSSTKAD